MDIGALMVRIEGDAKPLRNALAEADKGIGRFGQSANRQFDGMAHQFSRLFTDVVKGDIKGVGLALFSLLQAWPMRSGGLGGMAGGQGDLLGGLLGNGGLLGTLVDLFSKGRATGGPVTAGAPVLVGERGPELFTPYASGQVTPNHAIGASRPITLHMHITTPDAGSFRLSQGQILAEAAGSLARAQRFS